MHQNLWWWKESNADLMLTKTAEAGEEGACLPLLNLSSPAFYAFTF